MDEANRTLNRTADASPHNWLIRNYGRRCTLVCAASILRKLGAEPDRLVTIIERAIGFRERSGPPAHAYLGPSAPLDRAIESAAVAGGIRVRARTSFIVQWHHIEQSLKREVPVILNCYRAPSGRWSHSVLAISYEADSQSLLTVDPNDGQERWMKWMRPHTGWICTVTFIEPEQ